MPSVILDPSDKDSEQFVEVDPTGRYSRYPELLGSGAVKKVYRAFDQEEGIEVAWNQVKLRNFEDYPRMIDRLYSEVRLLRTLKNKNIISLHNVWRDDEQGKLNFITDVCTSGNLREYRKKHRHVSVKALKKWSKQILKARERESFSARDREARVYKSGTRDKDRLRGLASQRRELQGARERETPLQSERGRSVLKERENVRDRSEGNEEEDDGFLR